MSTLLDPRFGAVEDQIAGGLRSNSNHYSATGADALMTAWLEGLSSAALVAREDLDGDGFVGPGDLSVVLASWGECRGYPADLSDDGVVDGSDLAAMLAAWGTGF